MKERMKTSQKQDRANWDGDVEDRLEPHTRELELTSSMRLLSKTKRTTGTESHFSCDSLDFSLTDATEITYSCSAVENLNKYTIWFGTRFNTLQTELKFLNETAVLNRSTVYCGYVFRIVWSIILLVVGFLLRGHATDLCSEIESNMVQQCEDIAIEGGPQHSVRVSAAVHGYSFGFDVLGIALHWYIHRSQRIKNKAWALLAVWIIYASSLIGLLTITFLMAGRYDEYWALRMFLSYVYNFLMAVWFTGSTFTQSACLFVFTVIFYYGMTAPQGSAVLGKATQADLTSMELSTLVEAHIMYLSSATQVPLYATIALVSSYLNERTARMRFLERLMITHQQNNIIVQKTKNESMQRSFLENMLPASVVDKLHGHSVTMNSIKILSKRHEGVSILFADIAGFTSFAAQVDSAKVMAFLNELFLRLDDLCDLYNVYKVETVGDCYVAAVGVVTGQIVTIDDQHEQQLESSKVLFASRANAENMVGFAKTLISESRLVMKPKLNSPALMRVGIHSGPCMSGIVGTKNLRYCLFGDSMNTAARMEQTGVVDAIHVSDAVADLIPDEPWESRGSVTVKGKGSMETYLLHMKHDV